MTADDKPTLTPMLRQYFELKEQAEGAVLFFRMGDFYEIFGADAEEIAPKLDVVLTARERGDQTKIPFCGVPHHSATGYWLKLVKMGYKVAIVEQLEEAAPGKGLVKRGIVRVHTPGSIDELEGLDRDAPNYLLAHMELPGHEGHVLAVCDTSTGELRIGNIPGDQLLSQIRHFRPREILVRRFAIPGLKTQLDATLRDESIRLDVLPESPLKDEKAQKDLLQSILGAKDLTGQPCGTVAGGAGIVCAVITYIKSLQASTNQFLKVLPLRDAGTMILSDTAIRDLELFETSRRRQTDGSLARVIDRTLSPMGSRALRHALVHPFAVPAPITARHEAIARLHTSGEAVISTLRDELKRSADLARLATRLAGGSTSPLELSLIRETLERAEALSPVLEKMNAAGTALAGLSDSLKAGMHARHAITKAIDDQPNMVGTGRGVFRKGFDAKLDELADLASSGESRVNAYEAKLRAETGITSLKIKEHKTFGLLIEVTKSNFAKVPSSFIRRQTMVNCERFATMELQELNDALMSACDLAIGREAQMFRELVEALRGHRAELMQVAQALGELDMLQSFAWIALKEEWCRPTLQLTGKRRLNVKAGRHPVVEKFVGRHQFAANDIAMTADQSHLLITGPNMAGKSTVMRQTAILAILCQAGSYIPAKSAEMPIFDRVFTRVGAADDLSRGQSTFMVEMTEAAEILRQASDRSLVILDEVGRGTSTTDGLALASAILEDLVDRVGCFSLFATHYHELVPMMADRKGVRPVQTEVIEKNNREIVFTHRLIDGASGSSFGIEVAKLAGVPHSVLVKAREHLQKLEQFEPQMTKIGSADTEHSASLHIPIASSKTTRVQRELFGLESIPVSFADLEASTSGHISMNRIVAKLEGVRIHKTTPLQALNILDELKRMLIPTTQRMLFEDDTHAGQ